VDVAPLQRLALRYCSHHAGAHNNLASLLENEGRYQRAIYHYKQALQTKPNFSAYGLGETYYKQEQFPLSLEAHLHACYTAQDSRHRIIELLKENRYAITEKGQILNKESLLLLYDKTINRMISDCGFKDRMQGIFRHLTFHTGSATLTANQNPVRHVF